MALIKRTDLTLPKSYKSVKNFRDLALLATMSEAEGFCSKEEVLLAGEKVFSKLIIDDFFNNSDIFYNHLWLKYLYWDSGLIKEPREVILKAFDFAPHLPKPILPN